MDGRWLLLEDKLGGVAKALCRLNKAWQVQANHKQASQLPSLARCSFSRFPRSLEASSASSCIAGCCFHGMAIASKFRLPLQHVCRTQSGANLEKLRTHVVGGPDESLGHLFTLCQSPGDAKVTQLDNAIGAAEAVPALQVPVYDTLRCGKVKLWHIAEMCIKIAFESAL